MTWPMPRRLPIVAPPAHLETVASYLARLANLNSINGDELWQRVTLPKPTPVRRTADPALLSSITGHPPGHLAGALPELRDPPPTWPMFRHVPQVGCPRCDARHAGGPVLRLYPHHRYVCTRHRYWIGPPDINHPNPSLEKLPEVVAAQRRHLRLVRRHGWAATYDAVLTAFRICAHYWDDEVTTSIGLGRRRRLWTLRTSILIPPGTEDSTFSTSRLFAPIYPDAVEIADIIAAPHWRRLAAGDDKRLQRFLAEYRRRIGEPDYQPQGENDPLAHWIENDCWRAPTAPPRTFPEAPGHRRPSHVTTPHQMSCTRHNKSKEWFTIKQRSACGSAILNHRTVHPVLTREWTPSMQEWKSQIWITQRTTDRFKTPQLTT